MKLSKIGKRIYDKFDDTERRKIGIFRCKFHTPFLSRVDWTSGLPKFFFVLICRYSLELDAVGLLEIRKPHLRKQELLLEELTEASFKTSTHM